LTDIVDKATRSWVMSRIRGKDTGPEVRLRQLLWSHGVRFRKHDVSVPGKPDLTISKARLAVFVDGCFWHGCPHHYRPPKQRARYWREKLDGNRMRRRDVLRQLRAMDWSVAQIWECRLRENPLGVMGNLIKRIEARKGNNRVNKTPPLLKKAFYLDTL